MGAKPSSHSAITSYMYVYVHMHFPAVLGGLASTHPIVRYMAKEMQHKILHVKGMIQSATYVRTYTEEFRPHSSPSTVPRVYCAVQEHSV